MHRGGPSFTSLGKIKPPYGEAEGCPMGSGPIIQERSLWGQMESLSPPKPVPHPS